MLRRLACAVALLFACVTAPNAVAHDVPVDARINLFVKPEGKRLELLARVPMLSMQEVEFPTHGEGYLDVSRADESLRHAAKLWLIDNFDVYENGVRLAPPRIVRTRVSLPSDVSFLTYESARRHIDAPKLADDMDLYWAQQMLDVLLEYDIESDRSNFSIHPRVERFAFDVSTVLRFLPPSGAVRAFEFQGNPGLVRLDPRWHQAALRFLEAGFRHILGGIDHLLFLLCLVLPFRRLRPLVVLVTAFTVAHSISLGAAAFGFVPDALWFPPLIETLIAATIVYMALENIVGSNVRRRWVVAFAFGIIHGFGFSFLLRESFQFAGDHLVTSLVAFNLGVELGQIAVLLVLVPALNLLFTYVVKERLGIIIISAFVAHTGWHWMTERGAALLQFPFPIIDAAFLAGVMRAALAALLLAAGLYLASRWVRRGIGDAALSSPDKIARKT
jgi:hypothetical protein